MILDVLQEEWNSTTEASCTLNANLRHIRLKLSPLIFIGAKITQFIAPNISSQILADTKENMIRTSNEHWTQHRHEVCVFPGSGWKERLQEQFILQTELMNNVPDYLDSRRGSQAGEMDPGVVLVALKSDIMTLWQDGGVQALFKRRKLKIEEMPGL